MDNLSFCQTDFQISSQSLEANNLRGVKDSQNFNRVHLGIQGDVFSIKMPL